MKHSSTPASGALGVVARAVSVYVSANAADFPDAGLQLAYARHLMCLRPNVSAAIAAGAAPVSTRPRVAIVTVPKGFSGAAGDAQARSILCVYIPV